MKIDFIADTNFLIYLHEGNKIVEPFMEYEIGVSFISEVELLGFKGLTPYEEIALKAMLKDCIQIEWDTKLKEQTIGLRKKYAVKLPDAIIAATCLCNSLPLVTADQSFSKISELELFLIEV
jgi:predicted nucleic acid-binding protein